MTFCNQISDETKVKMRQLIDYTNKTGKEHGMKLCKIDNRITHSPHCYGGISSIGLDELHCPSKSECVAHFHTHPLGDNPHTDTVREMCKNPSYADLISDAVGGRQYGCISSGKNYTYCHSIPKDIIDKGKYTLGVYEDFRAAMKNLRKGIKEGVSEDKIESLDREVDKRYDISKEKENDLKNYIKKYYPVLGQTPNLPICKVDLIPSKISKGSKSNKPEGSDMIAKKNREIGKQ